MLMTLRIAFATSILLLAAGAFAQAEPEDAPEFEPMTVTPPSQPLDRPQRLLRALLEKSAPCLGCDIARQQHEARSVKLLKYLLMPTPPPEVDEATRLAFEVKLQDSPDLEYLRP